MFCSSPSFDTKMPTSAKIAKTLNENDIFSRIQRSSERQITKTDPYETSSTICQTSSIQGQEDRVTMKLDVAHTEHSHLIGRSGHCVKAMMLDTSCHIHFPDSNRAPNVIEKSNQVSISGRPNDVERARKRIREPDQFRLRDIPFQTNDIRNSKAIVMCDCTSSLRVQMLPLVCIFTIQNTSPQALTLYRTSYIVQQLEMKFSVEVNYRHYFAFPLADLIFRNHPAAKFLASSNTIVVSVRGLAFFYQQVIEATNILLEHHFGKCNSQRTRLSSQRSRGRCTSSDVDGQAHWLLLIREHKNVWMTTDIEPKHQVAMLNQASPRNLLDIIHDSTGARIWFPLGSSTNRVMDILQQQQSFNNLLPISPRRSGFYAPRLCPTPNPINSPFLSLFQRPEARTMVTMYGNVNACVMARKTLMNLLPVSLIAEISNEEAFILSRMDFSTFKSAYDVTVSFRSKARNSFRPWQHSAKGPYFRVTSTPPTFSSSSQPGNTIPNALIPASLANFGLVGEPHGDIALNQIFSKNDSALLIDAFYDTHEKYPTSDHRSTRNSLEDIQRSLDPTSITQAMLPASSFKESEIDRTIWKLCLVGKQFQSFTKVALPVTVSTDISIEFTHG
ncbi:hypothetical protein ACTXT7_002124 [Hymenolepis weldensis]